jgi:RNA polymerase sigma factor (sigma-70 family)
MPAASGPPADPSGPLLRQWQDDGDLEALDRLLQIEVGILKHMIRGRRLAALSASASTSDIAQEAVMGLLKTSKPPTFDHPGALRGYLWRSAWHLLVKRFEKQRRAPLRVELEESGNLDKFMRAARTLEDIDRADRALAIGLAMNLLSAEDRELLRLVYFEDQTIDAAGRALGLTREAASSRLRRARRQLAARLSDWAEVIA